MSEGLNRGFFDVTGCSEDTDRRDFLENLSFDLEVVEVVVSVVVEVFVSVVVGIVVGIVVGVVCGVVVGVIF